MYNYKQQEAWSRETSKHNTRTRFLHNYSLSLERKPTVLTIYQNWAIYIFTPLPYQHFFFHLTSCSYFGYSPYSALSYEVFSEDRIALGEVSHGLSWVWTFLLSSLFWYVTELLISVPSNCGLSSIFELEQQPVCPYRYWRSLECLQIRLQICHAYDF